MQYFLPFYKDNINKHIEKAILNADAKGVKVVSLAALNKVSLFFLELIIIIFISSMWFSLVEKGL